VVNVFSVTNWTRFGPGDVARVTTRRRAEDVRVLGDLGIDRIDLGWPDWPLRSRRQRSVRSEVLLSIAEICRRSGALHVLLPASVGQHPDHDFARSLAPDFERLGLKTSFYSDQPYAQCLEFSSQIRSFSFTYPDDIVCEKARRLLWYSSQFGANEVSAVLQQARTGASETVWTRVIGAGCSP
jgi:hypothetical protein